ncbi:MAG: c-type cytochrome biogenesis protein CcsB [Bacteroidales bacterium]
MNKQKTAYYSIVLKQIGNFLLSMRLMAVLIITLAVTLAVATFIENDYGIITARSKVYNAVWFEILLALLFINLTGNILIRKLYQRKKLTIFLFHLAFSIILIGGFVTRYVGEEGYMHIREGEKSDRIISDKTYIQIDAKNGSSEFSYSKPVFFSPVTARKFSKSFDANGHTVTLKVVDYIPNAIQGLMPTQKGTPVLELITPDAQRRKSLFFEAGETKNIGAYSVSFYDTLQDSDIKIYDREGELVIQSRYNLEVTEKNTWNETVLEKEEVHSFTDKTLYSIDGVVFVLKNQLPSGEIALIPGNEQNNESEGPDALVLEASSANNSQQVVIWGKQHAVGESTNFEFEGIDFTVSYGAKLKKIPFSLQLTDFRVERYAGSNSPSFFESEVILIDPDRDISEKRRIYMNNILKYQGYRFYQASYDSDEKGTVLSVNNDFAGTFFTYLGYIMLTIGMFLSLLNKNSRFKKLLKSTSVASIIILFFFLPNPVHASENSWEKEWENNVIDAAHAQKFGELLIQDNGGRIKPINTLSSQVLRKISRQTGFMGLTPDQVLLGMIHNPDYWQHVPIIKISHDEIKKILDTESDYISFNDIVHNNQSGTYPLAPYVEEANQKEPAYRSKFDNEIIRLDERVNICFVVFTTSIIKIFPAPNDSEDKWYSPEEIPQILSEKDSAFVSGLMKLYFGEINNSLENGDWSKPDEYLGYIKIFQEKHGEHIIPAESKQKLEVFYNRLNIFDNLTSLYGLLGLILLVLYFVNLLSRLVIPRIIYNIGSYLIILLFTAHTAGLLVRWYIAGHAPWSNGYEALTYIAWAMVLAGILFSGKSRISMHAPVIMASLILYVAHLTWMDPEITHLVPVLKSAWLGIHVSIITASYGFFALGALLALLNLILMNFKTNKNKLIIDRDIEKLTDIIELTLIVGLYMMTIGTFLGGVWANESWGRYWGWDPKETWALITVLVYAFIAHMRMIPGLQGTFKFNLMALFGFSSVIMTFFGVNFYLSGLHSYAAGDPLPIPDFIYYTITILTVISLLAYINHRKVARSDS